MMNVKDVVKVLEKIAPAGLAEDWDNVGLLAGDERAPVKRLLLCIDLLPAVLAEAARQKAEMVMAYHPIIFKPLSRVTANTSPAVHGAIRQGLAVYSMHTALDSAVGGVNDVLAGMLGLRDARPIIHARGRRKCKIVVFLPPDDLHRVSGAAFAAGAGRVGNYSECAFFTHGIGTFFGGQGSRPAVGRAGRHEAAEELRLEFVAPLSRAADVCEAIRTAHSYETAAIDVYPLEDYPEGCGVGRIGRLGKPMRLETIVAKVKRGLKVPRVRIAKAGGERGRISTVACLAGAGRQHHRDAAEAGAELLLTGELPHHDALAAAAAGMHVLCVGHSNSERIALGGLAKTVNRLLPELKVLRSAADRDPYEIV
jgi:dinuclear metal center YbgI/SA1388 family protein